MRDLNTIRNEALRAAKRAKAKGLVPKCLCAGDLEDGIIALRGIPFLGDYVPPGYQFVRKYFVDNSGFGDPGEPALTAEQFLAAIRKSVLSDNTYGYGILEAGQFQVYVGEYVKDDGRLALGTKERDEQEAYFGEGQDDLPIFLKKQAD